MFLRSLNSSLPKDLADLASVSEGIEFTLGQPFKPFSQLLGVLPSASRSLLPKPYARLMDGRDGPLAPFFPESFTIDM